MSHDDVFLPIRKTAASCQVRDNVSSAKMGEAKGPKRIVRATLYVLLTSREREKRANIEDGKPENFTPKITRTIYSSGQRQVGRSGPLIHLIDHVALFPREAFF